MVDILNRETLLSKNVGYKKNNRIYKKRFWRKRSIYL